MLDNNYIERGTICIEDLDIRQTRYGFGRERRLRLVFSGRPVPTWLRRETARRADAQLVEASELLGE